MDSARMSSWLREASRPWGRDYAENNDEHSGGPLQANPTLVRYQHGLVATERERRSIQLYKCSVWPDLCNGLVNTCGVIILPRPGSH